VAKYTKLTRLAMRELASGKTINERGIVFERKANGDGVFRVNLMVDGVRIHRVVGLESQGITLAQAEELATRLKVEARENRLSLPKGRKLALKFEEAAEKYLQKLEAVGGKDLAMKRMRLTLHLVPFFGAKPLSKISEFDIERYKAHRAKQPRLLAGIRSGTKYVEPSSGDKERVVTPSTINRELAVLSHLFSMAHEWGWVTHKPARIRRNREGDGRIEYLTREQADRLLEAARADGNAHTYAFCFIGLHTAMRMMEILTMRKEHVLLDRKMIHIPKAKAGAREQPMTKRLADFLHGYITALPDATPYLFSSPTSKTGHLMDIRKAFERVVLAAGLDPSQVVRHTLRHTAITHLVQAGVDLPTVQRISGHKSLRMVMKYAHQDGNHINEAMDLLDARYQSETKRNA
jgi:integrase